MKKPKQKKLKPQTKQQKKTPHKIRKQKQQQQWQ